MSYLKSELEPLLFGTVDLLREIDVMGLGCKNDALEDITENEGGPTFELI